MSFNVFERKFIDDLVSSVKINLVKAAAPVIREKISGDAAQNALSESLRAALVSFIAALPKMPQSDEKRLAEGLNEFFGNPDTAVSLSVLLRNNLPDHENLLFLWGQITPDKKPAHDIDLQVALNIFENVFFVTACRQSALGQLMDGDEWRATAGKTDEYLQKIEQLLDTLGGLDLNSLFVKAGSIRGIEAGGNIEKSIMITGDGNIIFAGDSAAAGSPG